MSIFLSNTVMELTKEHSTSIYLKYKNLCSVLQRTT